MRQSGYLAACGLVQPARMALPQALGEPQTIDGRGGAREDAAVRVEYSVVLGSVGDTAACVRQLGLALEARIQNLGCERVHRM